MRWFRQLIICALLSCLLLTGCLSFQSPALAWPTTAPPRNAAVGTKPVTLRVWFAADYADTAPIRDLVRDFEAAYPNVKVELRSGIVWENMRREVELAVTQGDSPDVAHYHAFVMGAQGLAEPVDDLWGAWNAEHEFMPGALEDVRWKGQRYGVPLDINALFTIYNKRIVREARLPEPRATWTFDDLEVMARRLTDAGGSQYALPLTTSGWALSGLISAAGGQLLSEENGRVTVHVDDPQVLRVLNLYRQLGLKDQVATLPPPIIRQSDHPVALFQNRKVALIFSGPWDLARLRQEAPNMMRDVGTAPLPRGKGPTPGGSVQGGGSLFVPRGSQQRELAFEFMKWAVSEPYARRLALELGRYPVLKRLYDDPALNQDPLLQPFFDQLTRARPYKLEAYVQADAIWEQVVQSVFDPATNLEQELARAQQEMQRSIDEVEAASVPAR